ncbi:MAG TPA: questin oxidase family protein, partial [Acidimicrobiales bacterium]|nr:questin oxidase family protein [Acidimicrobiales bacterium]
MTSTGGDEVLDEAYERLFAYGPEFEGYLSNHGPMVVEVLSRHQRSEVTHAWLDRYMRRLEPAPSSSSVIRHDEWRDALGDATRVGDWLGFFGSELEERPWREVLAEWWPRLAPGAVGAATHGLIRAGHAVRSVEAS